MDFEKINYFMEILSEASLEIEKIKIDFLLEDSNYNFSDIIPIMFKLNKKEYFVEFVPQKLTQTNINRLIILEELILKKEGGIPLFIVDEDFVEFQGISREYYVPMNRENIFEFLNITLDKQLKDSSTKNKYQNFKEYSSNNSDSSKLNNTKN